MIHLEGSYLISQPKTDWVMRKSKMTKKRPKSAIFYFWELGIGFGTCWTFFAKGSKVSDPSLFIRLDIPIFVHKKSSKVFFKFFLLKILQFLDPKVIVTKLTVSSNCEIWRKNAMKKKYCLDIKSGLVKGDRGVAGPIDPTPKCLNIFFCKIREKLLRHPILKLLSPN